MRVAITAVLVLGLGPAVHADDDPTQWASMGAFAEVPPTPAVAMTAIGSAAPCGDGLGSGYDLTCTVLERLRLAPGVIARLFRMTSRETRAPRSQPPTEAAYFVIVDDGDARWKSTPLVVTPNSVLCGRWTVPIATTARLREVHVDDRGAVALELHVANRANIIDPALCETRDDRVWRRTAFLVCGRGSAWSCSAASFGTWRDGPCTASLRDDGAVEYTCTRDDQFHLP